jgi:WD40 repeat protein
LWNIASEKNPKEFWKQPGELFTMSDYDYIVIAMGFTADGKYLAAASKVPKKYGSVRFWNVESGQLIKELTNPEFLVHAATFSSDSTQLAFLEGKCGAALWNLDSGGMERLSIPVIEGIEYCRRDAMLFSPDHKQLAVYLRDTIMIWSIRARNEHETFVGHGDTVTAIEISPDGRKLASASKDTMIKLWDLYSGKETKRLSGHKGSITAMTFSPNRTHLVTASADDTIRFWNAISGEEVDKLSRCGREIKNIAFSPNGEDLLWISPEGEVWLYKITWGRNRNYGVRGILLRNKKPEKLKGLTSPVTTIAFSGDGELRASGSEDGIVRFWNPASKESKFLEVHGATISAVAFLPDGKQLAVASSDNAVTLWNIMSGWQLQKITLFASVSSLKVSSDGQAMETDRGTIEFPGLFSRSQQSSQKPPRNIFFAGEWIYRGDQRLLWLPLEYRGRCWAVRGNLVVIGQESGAVTFLEFAMEKGNEVVD